MYAERERKREICFYFKVLVPVNLVFSESSIFEAVRQSGSVETQGRVGVTAWSKGNLEISGFFS